MTKSLHWTNFLFFFGTAVSALGGTIFYVQRIGLPWQVVFIFLFMLSITLLSITAGYHRLFTHRAYEASEWVKGLFLIVGAGNFQESCLKWASEHRMHHRYVDTDRDPYNVRKSFFWAHMGWILSNKPINAPRPSDLTSDRLVMWQHRYWVPVGILVGFGLPTLIGWMMGYPLGGFIFGGLLRMFVGHHVTFMVNSVAHSFGRRPYSIKDSSRDSALTAILTYGEGYHNFHHTFPSDYRIGHHFYDWDPGKWLIRFLSCFGQARDLRRTPKEKINECRMKVRDLRKAGIRDLVPSILSNEPKSPITIPPQI